MQRNGVAPGSEAELALEVTNGLGTDPVTKELKRPSGRKNWIRGIMNKVRQQLTEVEATAWVLIAIFVAVLLLFSFLFWKKLEASPASRSEPILQVVSSSWLNDVHKKAIWGP